MNAQQIRPTIAQILNIVGLALACVALAKLFGVNVQVIPGGIEPIALTAIACLLAK